MNLYLEMPKYGGHVGFYDKNNCYYNEKRTLEFIDFLSEWLMFSAEPKRKKVNVFILEIIKVFMKLL